MEHYDKVFLVLIIVVVCVGSTIIGIIMHDQHVRNENWAKLASCGSLVYVIGLDEQLIIKRYGYDENMKEYNSRCLQKP